MAQKFINLEEAAEKLSVTPDQLNNLRDEGKLRGYRDGSSWKFRVDDIDKFALAGLPEPSGDDLNFDSIEIDATTDDLPPISLDVDDEPTIDFDSIETEDEPAISDINLDDGDSLEIAAASDISLDDVDEGTVPADESLVDEVAPLNLDELETLTLEDDDDDESVLLSETEFGDSDGRPPSTIIGKLDLDPSGDMDLVLDSEEESGQSDVKLAGPGSGVLSMPEDTEISNDPEASRAQFSGIEELELDLEAESSQIHSSGDAPQSAPESDVVSGSEIGLADSASDAGLTGMSSLDLEEGSGTGLAGISEVNVGEESIAGSGAGLTGLSSFELEDDDDDGVLDEGSGSDITLSGQDSGINLIAPSDSGLALDDVPLDLSGAAMGSSLDLGDAVEEAIVLDDTTDAGKPEASGDFLLTPSFEEADGDADDESSSQIIALDEVSEDEGAAALLGGGGEEGMMGDDFAASGLSAGAAATVAPVVIEDSFSTGTVLALVFCVMLMCLCGMMSYDLVRNIWSWNETYSLNSALIDAVLSLLPS